MYDFETVVDESNIHCHVIEELLQQYNTAEQKEYLTVLLEDVRNDLQNAYEQHNPEMMRKASKALVALEYSIIKGLQPKTFSCGEA